MISNELFGAKERDFGKLQTKKRISSIKHGFDFRKRQRQAGER
jgi:hypothetical protein